MHKVNAVHPASPSTFIRKETVSDNLNDPSVGAVALDYFWRIDLLGDRRTRWPPLFRCAADITYVP